MIEALDINERWEAKTLKEVSEDLHQGINTAADRIDYKDVGYKILQAKHITSCFINDLDARNVSAEDYNLYKQKYRPRLNDILFSNIGTIGKSLVIKNERDFLIAWNIFLIRLKKEVNAEFVNYYLKYLDAKKFYNSIATGVATMFVNKVNLSKIVLPIPPEEIQQQIVSKIEELFSEIDKGIEEIKTAQQQLKVYRQAVLKWAFEGKLTNDNLKDNELPEGWKKIKLEKACIIKRGKSKHRPRNEPSLFGGKYPFIQTGDIRNANGGYISHYTQTYSEEGLQQSKLWPKGTLCITIAANIGETAILNFDACFPDSVVGLICNEEILLNKYTNYYFISYKSKLEEMAPATAQKNINVEILEKVEIQICTIEEQQQIVQEIESRLSVCDKIEETITNGLKQADALRQSILKKAFEGKLVK